MDLKTLLFSFKGRIPRSTYWLKFILPVAVINITLSVIEASTGAVYVDPNTGAQMGYLSLAFALVIIYPSLAVGVKRCHDRNRSGWFLLVMLIPIVSIWPLIELLFIRGTEGQNKFGEDSLQAALPSDASAFDQAG